MWPTDNRNAGRLITTSAVPLGHHHGLPCGLQAFWFEHTIPKKMFTKKTVHKIP